MARVDAAGLPEKVEVMYREVAAEPAGELHLVHGVESVSVPATKPAHG